MSFDDTWWPADEELRRDARLPMRGIEVCYAALGPVITHHLRLLLDSLPDDQVADAGLVRLRDGLRMVDGRQPQMLVMMATAAAAVAIIDQRERGVGPEEDNWLAPLLRRGPVGDAFKFFGWQVVEQVQAFGLERQAFLDYVDYEMTHAFDGAWPPAGAAYTRRPPTPERAVADTGQADRGRRGDGPFDFWQSLRSYPSLVGAHLVDLRLLTEYVARLDAGLQTAAIDLAEVQRGGDPVDVAALEQDLRDAVSKVHEAVRMIDEAQEMIVSIFST